MTYQDFTSSSTWITPTGVTSFTIECIGYGGDGGDYDKGAGGTQATGGGGGGAYSFTTVGTTGTFTITFRADSCDVTSGLTTYCKAYYGSSVSDGVATGGAGGLASSGVGDIKRSGGDGANGNLVKTPYGGGGGEAGSYAADGNNAIANAGGTGGDGADGGTGPTTEASGQDGNNYGGGGSGMYATSDAGYVGGIGGSGRIRISWEEYTIETNVLIALCSM